ncbi:MAG: hypothetical protein AAFZ17_04105 [Cyanobacteria bacterium J06650_10]
MDYLTETDKAVLLLGGLGLAVGLLTSAQETGLDWWLKKEWFGWDSAISRAIVSAIVWALLLGSMAFINILYEPMKPIVEIRSQILSLALFIVFSLPVMTRALPWTFEKFGQIIEHASSTDESRDQN